MTYIRERACAKLNISLDVTGRREDGYHDMLMVMQSISLCDELKISLNSGGKITSSSNLHFVPNDERNLAVRAAKEYLTAIGESGRGVRIDMRKNIPVGAGMAGGSTDAAAVLRGMNSLFQNRLSPQELAGIAGNIGSDVVFCLCGGTALAKGRGEQLTVLPDMPDCVFVICKPEFSISTPELFKKLDKIALRRHPDTAGIIKALEQAELEEVCRRMYNVFEDVDDRRMRTVSQIKSRLLDFGALGAVMTGTGSAVYGVFRREQDGLAALETLGKEYRFCRMAKCAPRLQL